MDETPARQCANGSATSQDGVDGARLEPYALSGSGLAGAVGCVVAALLPPFMTGALAVQVSADLRFGETALGIAVSVFFVTAAVTSVPLGRAAEKHGPARALRWAGGTSALCLLGIAGAARTYGVLVGLLAIGGAAVAAAQPAANALIADHASRRRQGLTLGMKQASVPVAMVASGLAVPAFAVTIGWRWGYVAAAIVAVVAIGLVPSVPPDSHRPSPRPGALRVRPLFVLTIGFGLGTAATNTVSTFAVQSAVTASVSQSVAGYLLVAGSAGAFVVFLLAGMDADVRPGRELRVTAMMLVVGAVFMAILATGAAMAFIIAVPMAVAIGSGWPGLVNLAVVRTSPAAPGTATGRAQTGAYAGAVLGPPLFGLVAENMSYLWAWIVTGICAFCAAGVVVLARRLFNSAGTRTLGLRRE